MVHHTLSPSSGLTCCSLLSQLDSWSVILNGAVEVTCPEGRAEILCMGNSFGVSPTMEKEYMKGVMKTKVDDCQVQISLVGMGRHMDVLLILIVLAEGKT